MWISSDHHHPTATSNSAPASPHSPSRMSRLRGLSYLLHSRSDPDSRSRESNSRHAASDQLPSPAITPPPIAPASVARTQSNTPPPTVNFPSTHVGWLSTALDLAPTRSSAARADTSTPPATTQSGNATSTPSPPMTRDLPEGPRDHPLPSIRFIPHHDPRATRPSLTFQALSRTLPSSDSVIRVGRYSERDAQPGELPRGQPSAAPVGFKSKVVSRRHCEFWYEGTQWFIRDVKSSSGTFLNHLRLSPPGVESKPWPINDGDVVQLGIDFRGGEEMIFRCVKIRIELNRNWQQGLNNFNKSTHKRLRKLAESKPKRDSDTASLSSSECAICLMAVSPCQSLFVAPCSHVWHYKCIRPILNGPNYPQFLCPNCRAVADLEAEIEEHESDWEEDLHEAIQASKNEPPEAKDDSNGITESSNTNGPAGGQAITDADGDLSMIDAMPPPDRPAPQVPTTESTTAIPERNLQTPTPVNSIDNPPRASTTTPVHGQSAAVPIPSRGISATRRFDVLSNGPSDGPVTPRNDAGPFVLDGGAGRGGSPENEANASRTTSHLNLVQAIEEDRSNA